MNSELILLRDFFEAWEAFHAVAQQDVGHKKKAEMAQKMVDAAARVRNFKEPLNA